MKFLAVVILILFSLTAFSQLSLNAGDKIESGKMTLANNEIIQFYRLECRSDDKVSFINNYNLESEFLYLSSIKSIDTGENSVLSDGRIAEIEKIMNVQSYIPTVKVEDDEKTTYSTFEYKDETVQLENPKSGKAAVYFVRTNSNGFLINFRHFHYDKFIGKFADKGYIRYECDPGEQVFWIGASNSSYVTANLEAGKIYVIETIPVMGMAYAKVNIEIANKFNTKKYLKQKKRILAILSNKDLERNPNYSDLENQSDYRKEIERGIKIYNKRVKKEQDHLLHSNQYFE